jgi:hypothetical protein
VTKDNRVILSFFKGLLVWIVIGLCFDHLLDQRDCVDLYIRLLRSQVFYPEQEIIRAKELGNLELV